MFDSYYKAIKAPKSASKSFLCCQGEFKNFNVKVSIFTDKFVNQDEFKNCNVNESIFTDNSTENKIVFWQKITQFKCVTSLKNEA